ncbi:HmuY family protein [Sediminicola luteus]|nr:HmuY family protein [Sediminicola luteus]
MKFMKYYFTLIIVALLTMGCSSDDNAPLADFVVAFENPSLSFGAEETEKPVNIVFSVAARENGTLTISYTDSNTEYGTDKDYTTDPAASNGSITVPFSTGETQTSFTFNKLRNAIEGGAEKSVNFTITQVSVADAKIQGNTSTKVDFAASAATAGSISPEVGGPNEPNQVFVDLSSLTQKASKRDAWELGFYMGDDHRVIINGSLFMAVAQLEETNLAAVTEATVADLKPLVAVGTFQADNIKYVDGVDGDLSKTAIAQIAANDDDNKVYLVNLGSAIGTESPNVGSVDISDDPRGWKKIKILRSDNGYRLQYADLDVTDNFDEISIAKNSDSGDFRFVSFTSQIVDDVRPVKWDMNFTVFTNEIPGYGSYGYADFIATNRLGGVSAYKVETSEKAYADFVRADVVDASFDVDQRAIGSAWRNGGGPGTLPSIKDEVFFVLKDTDENLYKIRFTALTDADGVRGNPAFEFELLQ